MGVSTEVWRCRIGIFNKGQRYFLSYNSLNAFCTILPLSLILINILLLIGCVESNSGPSQLQCTVCSMVFNDVHNFAKHQEVHASRKNFSYLCCECDDKFVTAKALEVHFSRYHRHSGTSSGTSRPASSRHDIFADVLLRASNACTVPICQETLRTARFLKQHMVNHIRRGYVVLCPFQPCQSRFTKVATFRTDYSQCHRGEEHADETISDPRCSTEDNGDGVHFDDDDEGDDFGVENDVIFFC